MNEIMMQNSAMSIIDSVDVETIQGTMQKIQRFQSVIQHTLKQSHDYGEVPGTSKPTLLKPGAEKICMLMGINPEYEIMSKTEDYRDDFFAYNFRCRLMKNGFPVSEGVGSCNSKEKKYRYVWVDENKLPIGTDPSTLESKDYYGRVQYKVENKDVCSLANTILKMAKKRALIDATLQVASLSEIFTQDIEDMQEFIQSEQVQTMTPDQAAATKMTFGKYKGMTLKEIYKKDIGYFDWLKGKAKSPVIRKACEIMIKSIKQQNEERKQEATEQVGKQS